MAYFWRTVGQQIYETLRLSGIDAFRFIYDIQVGIYRKQNDSIICILHELFEKYLWA